ncbi:unnamed protein product [Polarella glacialis]|uniref:J domain-containing protein n=1 Tax=Polarella glacialis TaxID=89957 RepID=A0A813LEX3_POLGL|nr:unnamed protein product [Polarella glacialis]
MREALGCHPDKGPPEEKAWRTTKFQELSDAYSTLEVQMAILERIRGPGVAAAAPEQGAGGAGGAREQQSGQSSGSSAQLQLGSGGYGPTSPSLPAGALMTAGSARGADSGAASGPAALPAPALASSGSFADAFGFDLSGTILGRFFGSSPAPASQSQTADKPTISYSSNMF